MKFKRVYILILGLLLVFFPYLPISADENNTIIDIPITTQKELQQAINSLDSSGGEIWLSQDLALSSTLYFPEDNSVTIDGKGYKLSLNAGVQSRHICISANNNKITLKNLTLAGNGWGKVGGGISVNGKVELVGCTLENNFAPNGGGLIIAGGTVVMKDSEVTNNGSHGAGGGAHLSAGGSMAVYDSRFEGNKATQGGAVYATGGSSSQYTLHSETSEYMGNMAVAHGNEKVAGGGIAAVGNNTALKLVGCKVEGNSSENMAGGIYAGGMLETVGTDLSDNTAQGNGGGAYIAYKAIIDSGSIIKNKAAAQGGGLYVDNAALNHLSINGTDFNDNTAPAYIAWNTGAFTDETTELYAQLLSSGMVSPAGYTKQGSEEANVFNDADINISAKTSVSFDAGGGYWQDGSGEPYAEQFYLGDSLRLPTGLTKGGSRPTAWQDEDGNAVKDGTLVTGPATYYPVWTKATEDNAAEENQLAQNDSQAEQPATTYRVTFALQGSSTTRAKDIAEGSKLTEPAVNYDGYTLKGWYVDDTERKWDFEKDTVQADMRLEARWE